MSLESTLKNTTCSKGHVHPPWNTTGVLSIAKCESICGFCQKETKTASNLRKHVARHIKNEGLNLMIAEGSSGRGRLGIPTDRAHSSSSRLSTVSNDDDSMNSHPSTSITALNPRVILPTTDPSPSFSPSQVLLSLASSTSSSTPRNPNPLPPSSSPTPSPDPFHLLRAHHLTTKPAWTAIPSTEGIRILEHCKSRSLASDDESHVPCYNREIIFDDEWLAHMKDVHGVFLLWPQTWMRRIEVLDLDALGGDIEACNEVIMDH